MHLSGFMFPFSYDSAFDFCNYLTLIFLQDIFSHIDAFVRRQGWCRMSWKKLLKQTVDYCEQNKNTVMTLLLMQNSISLKQAVPRNYVVLAVNERYCIGTSKRFD